MANEMVSRGPTDVGSLFKKAARRMEYLRGKEGLIGFGLKAFAVVGGVVLFYKNMDKINAFLDGVVNMETTLIYGGVLAAVLWVMWLVLTSDRLKYTVAMVIDIMIEKIHRFAVARNKEGSASWSINRLSIAP